jgi:hypothetical protein
MALVRDHRQDAAACVSLSKSTMSKIRPTTGRTRRNRRRRGRRVSIRLAFDCQPPCLNPRNPRDKAQKSPPGPKGKAPQSVSDSIEGAETNAFPRPRRGSWGRRRRFGAKGASELPLFACSPPFLAAPPGVCGLRGDPAPNRLGAAADRTATRAAARGREGSNAETQRRRGAGEPGSGRTLELSCDTSTVAGPSFDAKNAERAKCNSRLPG